MLVLNISKMVSITSWPCTYHSRSHCRPPSHACSQPHSSRPRTPGGAPPVWWGGSSQWWWNSAGNPGVRSSSRGPVSGYPSSSSSYPGGNPPLCILSKLACPSLVITRGFAQLLLGHLETGSYIIYRSKRKRLISLKKNFFNYKLTIKVFFQSISYEVACSSLLNEDANVTLFYIKKKMVQSIDN